MKNLFNFNSLPSRLSLLIVIFSVICPVSQGQGIFRDKRDVKPIIPTIVPPEGPVIPGEEGMEPEEEGVEGEEQPITAMPVIDNAAREEVALNREREAAANVSSPGLLH